MTTNKQLTFVRSPDDPTAWAIIDVTTHPNGEVTAVVCLTSDESDWTLEQARGYVHDKPDELRRVLDEHRPVDPNKYICKPIGPGGWIQ